MTEFDAASGTPRPPDSLVRLTHIIYALHAFTVVTGIISTTLIITAFLTGWPSIIAVILNYAKRSDARGTFLESHFRWQIRTFWFAVLWMLIGGLLMLTLIGIPAAILVLIGAGLWVFYRIVRGWLRLNDRQPMPI
jgi:uncharacterized membrane protein